MDGVAGRRLPQGGPRRAPQQSQGDSWRGQAALIQRDLAFGCHMERGHERDGRGGRARSRRQGSHTRAGRWEMGPLGWQGQPSHPKPGHVVSVQKIREGGTALLGWAAGNETAPSSSDGDITTRKTLHFPGVGDMGRLAEAEVRVGGRKVSLLLSSTLEPPAHPAEGFSRARTSAGRLSWCRWPPRSWSCRWWCHHWDLPRRMGTAPGRTWASGQ